MGNSDNGARGTDIFLFHTLITILLNYDLMSVYNIQALLNMADG